jgi:hypothetical protein
MDFRPNCRRMALPFAFLLSTLPGDAGLVTWYKFDEAVGATTAADSSGTGATAAVTFSPTANNGTLSAFQPAGGKFGGAMYLNGTASWAETPDRPQHKFLASQSFSYALWFKSDGTATSLPSEYGSGLNQGLISKTYFGTSYLNNYLQLQLTVPATGATTAPYFSIDSRVSTTQATAFRIPGAVTAPNPVDNAWHHLVMVMDRSVGTYGQMRLYIDNVLYNTTNCTNAAGGGYWDMGSAGPLVIGNHQNRYCRGWFDDVGIWNHALLVTEIDSAFRLGIGGSLLDSDNDGLVDSWETTYFGNLAQTGSGDPDADGLTNAQEFTLGTNPSLLDTDGDGLGDGAEVNTHTTNPLVADTDGDTLSDGAEVTVHNTNPKSLDSDGDNYQDDVEVAAGTNPNSASSFPPPALANLHINEFVSENQPRPNDPTAPVDIDGEYPDWLEIRNNETTPVNLQGWHITDDPAVPDKYLFPSTTIPAGGYHVVFCSPRKRSINGVQVHTGFKLGSTGVIQLIRPLGGGQYSVVSSIGTTALPYPNQRPTVSYGRSDNSAAGTLAYLTVPTPGAANVAANAVQEFAKQTHFSVDRGMYTAPVATTITSPTLGASIAYTLNGSEPTPTNGTQIAPADAMTAPTVTLNISSTTLVRARAYKAGLGMSNIDTHSYIFPANVMTQNAPTPSMGLTAAETMAWGGSGADLSNISAFTVGGQPLTFFGVNSNISTDPVIDNQFMQNDLMTLPTLSLVANWKELFGPSVVSGDGGIYPPAAGVTNEGVDRRASVEFLNPNASSTLPNAVEGFQADSNIHIFGGTSQSRWKSYKLSLRVQLKNDLNYKLYGDSAANRFSNFVLDSTMNNTWMHPDNTQRSRSSFVRDFIMADLQNKMGQAGFHTRPVHLYLNGLYWGVYFLHEKPDHHFNSAYYGGDSDNWDVFKHSTHPNFTESDPHVNTNPVNLAAGVARPTGANPAGNSTCVNNFEALLDLLGTGNVGANPAVLPDLAVPANYQAVAAMLDIDAFIDYMLLNFLAGNQDWADKNLYAGRQRVPGAKWRFYSWDAEHTFRTGTENFIIPGTGGAGNEANPPRNGNPKQIHGRLRTNPEYLLRFADRIRKHMFDGGALSVAGMKAAFDTRHNEIKDAIRAESARWGHIRASLRPAPNANVPYKKSDWLLEVARLTNAEVAGGTSLLQNRWNLMMGTTGHFRNATNGPLYPAIAAPEFSQAGGNANSPFNLTISHTNATGDVYYTTNGADPRLEGGAVNLVGGAMLGTSVTLSASTVVKARVLAAGVWSALTEHRFILDTVPASAANLVISEINYRPASPTTAEVAAGFGNRNDFEYIELMNIGTSKIDLTGLAFVSGINFDFTNAAIRELSPGARLVLVENAAAATMRYGSGLPIAGEFALSSGLANEGEQVTLVTASGVVIKDFAYDDDAPWPVEADGAGFSLVLQNPRSNPDHNTAHSWRPSYAVQGTPGAGEGAGYSAWKNTNNVPADYSDSDLDGLPNAVEYVLGTNPNSFTPTPELGSFVEPHLLANGIDEAPFLTLSFTRDPRNDDVAYTPEFSTELVNWSSGVRVSVSVNPDGTQTEVWRSTVAFPADARRFAHIRVTVP